MPIRASGYYSAQGRFTPLAGEDLNLWILPALREKLTPLTPATPGAAQEGPLPRACKDEGDHVLS